MYVILTSKPGQFRTETDDAFEPVETYDYFFCERKRARFVIARLLRDSKVRIVDELTPSQVNHVPSRLLPIFDSIEKARDDLRQLIGRRNVNSRLVKL